MKAKELIEILKKLPEDCYILPNGVSCTFREDKWVNVETFLNGISLSRVKDGLPTDLKYEIEITIKEDISERDQVIIDILMAKIKEGGRENFNLAKIKYSKGQFSGLSVCSLDVLPSALSMLFKSLLGKIEIDVCGYIK